MIDLNFKVRFILNSTVLLGVGGVQGQKEGSCSVSVEVLNEYIWLVKSMKNKKTLWSFSGLHCFH